MFRYKNLIFALLFFSVAASATPASDSQAKAYAWLINQQKGDGSWLDSSNSQLSATAVAIQGMALSGMRYGYVSGAGANWVLNEDANSTDAISRQIITATAMGMDTSDLVQKLLASRSKGQSGAAVWGAYSGYELSMPDTALGLEALQAAGRTEAGQTITILSQLQLADGGWAYGSKNVVTTSNLVPTVDAVRVIAEYVIAHPTAKDATLDTAMTKAINRVLALKKNDNGFAEDANVTGTYDPTKPGQILETSSVWLALSLSKQANFTGALTATVTTTLTNAESFLIAKQSTDGSFGGDALLTASMLRMWALNGNALADADHDGVPNVVEAALGSNSNVADTRNLPKGNGNPAAQNTANASADVPLPPWSIALLGIVLLITIVPQQIKQIRN